MKIFYFAKRNIAIILLSIPFLIGGSCEKRNFSFVSNVNQVVTFEEIETERETYKVARVSTYDIKKSLDIPTDGKVTEVFIRDFKIEIIKTPANTVDNIYTSAVITSSDGLQKILWEEQQVSLTSGSRYKRLNDLVKEGVDYLKNVIEETLYSNKNTNYEFGLSVFPIGEKFAADIKVTMNVQVAYDQCVEVLDYLDAGEECKK